MFVDLVDSDSVLKAVQMRGPMIPMEIRKFLGKGDSITIGAALSTLLSKGLIKSTTVKIGGSPFYYVRGQENKLELLSKYLNDKDKRMFETIRQEKILKDSSQEPLARVSLRSINDFAKKVEHTNNGETTLYWRWYMISEDDAIRIIRGDIQKKDITPNTTPPPEIEQITNNQAANSATIQNKNTTQNAQAPQNNQNTQINQSATTQRNNTNEPFKEKEIKKEQKQNVKMQERSREKAEAQTTITEVEDFDDDFFLEIKTFFEENKIKIRTAEMIRRGSDYELTLSMRTPFGETEYFCKAKSKKKCNEGDLSTAYLQGQNKRLPTVFITTGEITKKAKEKIKTDYKGLLVKEL
ncbi:MAG: hypothetical protein ACLFN8_05410 [Candidatus Woesearchaeota archaeon]